MFKINRIMAARCNAKLQVELESAQSAEFQNFNRKGGESYHLISGSERELVELQKMFPPLVQEAMKLLIECNQFENRLMDVARLAFDRLEDEHPEEGPDEYTVKYYNEIVRPHIDAIHKAIMDVLVNKLENNTMDVVC